MWAPMDAVVIAHLQSTVDSRHAVPMHIVSSKSQVCNPRLPTPHPPVLTPSSLTASVATVAQQMYQINAQL